MTILNVNKVAERLVEKLKLNKLTIATAESCTGGIVASALVSVPGCSSVFHEGYITYSNGAKCKLLNIGTELIETHGAVSKEVAAAMARGAAMNADANIGLAITGIAGPDGGTKSKPIGMVFIGIYVNGIENTHELMLAGNRTEIRNQSAYLALELLTDILEII